MDRFPAPLVQPARGQAVPKHVRVKILDAGLPTALTHNLADAIDGYELLVAGQPEPGSVKPKPGLKPQVIR